MTNEQIAESISDIEIFSEVPKEQIEWLITNSQLKHFKPGDYLFEAQEPAYHLYIILEGTFRIQLDRNGKTQQLSDMEKHTVTGVLPYSRMKVATAHGQAIEDSMVVALHKEHFDDMICNHHELTEVFVHLMTDRIRNFTTLQQQNEKLSSLGKLSAGLAHELNNPASAVVRSSEALKKHLGGSSDKFKQVMLMKVDPAQVDVVSDVLYKRLNSKDQDSLSLMEKTSLEDDLTDWMDDHEIEDSMEIAEVMAEFSFQIKDLEQVNELVPNKDLSAVFHWMCNTLVTEKMVDEIANASSRISDLIGSIKNYTHMDRGSDKQPTDLHNGLRSTLTMLGHKIKQNNVKVIEHFGNIPKVNTFAGEVNQVFTNIIDNAVDAMEENGGTLTITTKSNKHFTEVHIEDTGIGIPEDIVQKIFDPFFTTKDIGKGTGMGLDLVLKIMKQRHGGDIKVVSEPGKTIFTLCFPI